MAQKIGEKVCVSLFQLGFHKDVPSIERTENPPFQRFLYPGIQTQDAAAESRNQGKRHKQRGK
ncbi:hypothetical protein SDC9_127193 [bioreactor metagenome]|uniref:Uncharacterized protein n=1 Tax=bioreactor metagenome TaxID=1076179 RepID=A0A645CT94_9ZZZZ